MTKEWYKAHGYNVSINIDQSAIDRAEKDVMDAYILPILPSANPDTDKDVERCLANISYLLVMQRSIFITRSGAKEKTTTNSMSPDGWRILEEGAQVANMSLNALRKMEGAVPDAKVTDICKFKFTTNFIHT